MKNSLTRLGPGKFGYLVDLIAWEFTIYGAHDTECGDAATCGWWGLFRGPLTKEHMAEWDIDYNELNDADYAYLGTAAGLIVDCDEQGFVEVQRYRTSDELEKAWSEREAVASAAAGADWGLANFN